MQTYQVQRDRESLVARLMEDGDRTIEVTYRNAGGDTQVSTFSKGYRVFSEAKLADGSSPVQDEQGNTSLYGILVVYDRLGPELREQIPSDWHAVLGLWLAPK